jgi:biopolymer transport protein ExbB/TolQ
MEIAAAASKPVFIVAAFDGGGVFMYFILTFFVLTLGLIVERTIFFARTVKQTPPEFRKNLLASLLRGEYRNAETYAKSFAATALGRIAAVGSSLRARGAGDEEVQARMDEKLATEISKIDRRTGFLAMYGNVSTLLGLLGTIVGMIHSFAAVASANPADRATMLSKGISEAMNCTAFGLITAIPALVAYAYFQNKTDRLVSELTESTTEIYHDLIFLSEGELDSKPARPTAKANKAYAADSVLEA